MDITGRELWDDSKNPVTELIRIDRAIARGEIETRAAGFESMAMDALAALGADDDGHDIAEKLTPGDVATLLQEYAEEVFDQWRRKQ
jgi:hypothetical protein